MRHARPYAFAAMAAILLTSCDKPASKHIATPRPGELPALLAERDSSFRWEADGVSRKGGLVIESIRLTSQTWQGIPWRHTLTIYRTEEAAHPEFCLIYNTGGGSAAGSAMADGLARLSGCSVAVLTGVPNQPLFNGRSEDALIAYTWGRFFDTGDPEWILNVPMTRSVLRAMDAVQAARRDNGGPAVTGFCITGASKRGWTAWLAGASGDNRVKAIAPIVFDMLNIPAQIRRQIETFGSTSEMIADYSDAGFLSKLDSPQGRQLVDIVDPYAYRDRLTMPKLMILGANDRYWATDALGLYWEGLRGPRAVLYEPNAGHGLLNLAQVGRTLAVFTRASATNITLPSLRAEVSNGSLRLTSDAPPVAARVYRAHAATRDFRSARWEPEPMIRAAGDAAWSLPLEEPASGFTAVFAEADYRVLGDTISLCTPIRVIGTRSSNGRR